MKREPFITRFPGFRAPSTDFDAVRDGRRSLPFYFDVDLSTARTIAANTALLVNVAGNSFYSDPVVDAAGLPIGGIAIVHFHEATLNPQGTPFTIAPQAIMNVPFTQLLIENPAQPGKKLRVVYGVDLDFSPGINAQVQIAGIVSVREYGLAYGASFASNTNLVNGTNETILAPASNVNGVIVWSADIATAKTTASTNVFIGLLAKTSAPASAIDGDVLLSTLHAQAAAVTGGVAAKRLERPVLVAAGKGLYFRNSGGATEDFGYRAIQYTVL